MTATDKTILTQYIDACTLVDETEAEIRKIKRRRKIVHDSVKGSLEDYPYTAQSIHISGVPYNTLRAPGSLERQEQLLEERLARAEDIKVQVEAWINTVPMRMQRIIQYKIFQRLSWEEVAEKMRGKCTAESVKKEYQRFIEKN